MTDVEIEVLLAYLRIGRTLKDAARVAGIPIPTLKWSRRHNPDLDVRVIEAAEVGGTILRPARQVTCPGDLCGTPTGYDYGCKKGLCRDAKSAKVTAARARQRPSPKR